jgi:hypothetical protein
MHSREKKLKNIKTITTGVLILLLVANFVFAFEDKPVLNVPKLSGKMNIDARLDEPQWQNAMRMELNYETRPGDNVKPSVRTEFLMFYDQDRLYVAFKCYDPDPNSIRAHLMDRDGPMNDDTVWIQVDTFNDERRCYDFATNPIGVQLDSIEDFSGARPTEDFSWDGIWESAGKIYDWGYLVEWSIPFSSFRFQKKDGPQTWGINAARFRPRNVSARIDLVPVERGNNCYLCQIAKISGFEGVEPGRNIELNPTATFSRTDMRNNFPHGDLEEDNSQGDLGITGSWGITPNWTISGTVNPDFSQIEADAAQLDINNTFTLFYPEKRPFFMEGSDFFLTPINAVHTRVLANPDWGMRFTGKEGGNAMGAYVVRDAVTQMIIPGPLGSRSFSAPMENTSSVARYRRDVGSSSTLGLLVTDREGDEYYNRVAGVDGNIRLNSDNILSFQVMASQTQYGSMLSSAYHLTDEEITDSVFDLSYIYNTRNYEVIVTAKRAGENFRADLGYFPKVGFQRYGADFSRNWWGDANSFVRKFKIGISANQENRIDSSDDLTQRELFLYTSTLLPNNTQLTTIAGQRKYNFMYLNTDQSFVDVRLNSVPMGWLSIAARIDFSDWIDFANIREAYRKNLTLILDIKANQHLNLNSTLRVNSLSRDGNRIFLANLLEVKGIYQFNRRMFFRSIFQFTDIRRSLEQYSFPVDSHSKKLFTQQLFSYKINPRTVLFLGYGDTYLGNQEYGITQSDRSFFAKVGYAWVL